MAASIKPYPFNPVDYPEQARLRIEPGTAVVDVESARDLTRAVGSGYTAHSEGDRGHSFIWKDRGRYKVVNWQEHEEGPARTITFLDLDDAAEYSLSCVQ